MSNSQALGPGASFREYISDGWNKLDCVAIGFFIVGFVLRHLSFITIRDLFLLDSNAILELFYRTTPSSNKTTPSGPVEYARLPRWAFNSEDAMRAVLQNGGLSPPSSILANWKSEPDLSMDHPYFILTEESFNMARIFFALSLFAFVIRLMYIFSFSIVLGPKLIMITRMVSRFCTNQRNIISSNSFFHVNQMHIA